MRLFNISNYRTPILFSIFIHIIFLFIVTINWSSYSDKFSYKREFKALDASLVFIEKNKPISTSKPATKPETKPETKQEAKPKPKQPLKPNIESKSLINLNNVAPSEVLVEKKISKISKFLNEDSSLSNYKKNTTKENATDQTNNLIKYYASLISQQMKMRWTLPSSAKKNMVSEVKIKILPTGDISSIHLSLSSGDNAFDQSTLLAVERAGRFEFMKDMPRDIFENNFREFTFRFSPEDL